MDDAARFAAVGLADGPHRALRVVRDADLWNVSSEKGLVLPVAVGERGARFTLVDPDGKAQALSVDALGGDRYGIGLDNLTRRGIYRVKAERSDAAAPGDGALLWEIPLAVNGPAEESQLAPVQKSQVGGQELCGCLGPGLFRGPHAA